MPANRLASTLLCGVLGSSFPLLCLASESSYLNTELLPKSYTSPDSEMVALANGVVLEGSNLNSIDNYTSGFRLTAGFSPDNFPQVDIGAEIAYRESEEVFTTSSVAPLVQDTLALGGALVAGLRMGAFSVYAKSGLTEWRGENELEGSESGTAMLQGFGATMTVKRLVSRLEYERIDAPTLSNLTQLNASIHLPF
ncbi:MULTISPECIES: hypothetical protein [unclassified Halomonas]|uniref:hypothetical protein n=1 Tax=unclassified Halomonas TaxID=2609666 RepID=UPI002076A660|nr:MULTISPECIES: hypothetical protein [unclassified Halomonas]